MMNKLRLQSAMEYLMTYGWAILIIAVVLGALFSLGVFNGGASLGTACVASAGFLCQAPITLGTNGNVTLLLGQSTGTTMYNIALACTATTYKSTGLPNPLTATVVLYSNGMASNVISGYNGFFVNTIPYISVAGTPLTLVSGQTVTISGLKCFSTTGAPFATGASSAAIGASFSGAIYMNYSTTSTLTQGTTLTQRVATITLKVV
mgnify:CR=1 FL=1